MFKLDVSPDFAAQVNAEITGESGRAQKVGFSVRFKRLSATDFEALMDQVRQRHETKPEDAISDQDVVDQVLVGFGDDLRDAQGEPLAFTRSNVLALCDVYPLRACIVRSFFEGYTLEKQKN